MKNRSLLSLVFVFALLPCFAMAQLSDAHAVGVFLKEQLSELNWELWLAQNTPEYGNYCTPDSGNENFGYPCLGRLDCVCKAHDFSVSLKKYLKADVPYLKKVLGASFEPQKLGKDNGRILQAMTSKLFAARLMGVDISQGIRAAMELYKKNPQEGLRELDQIVDENEIFRKKIEEINIERIKYDDRKQDGPELDSNPITMAVSMQPFPFISGLFYLNYEYKLSNVLSLRLGASVYATGLITDTYLGYGNNNKDFSTFVSLGLKSFVNGSSLKSGLYFEPIFEFGYENVARFSEVNTRDRDIALVPGILFGLEKIFLAGLQVDVGFGGGMHIGLPISNTSFTTFFVVPKVRASIGYAW